MILEGHLFGKLKAVASGPALDQAGIRELIERNKDKKFLTLLLETLRAAASLKEQVIELDFRGVQVDMRLGLLPNVEVGRLTKVEAHGATQARARRSSRTRGAWLRQVLWGAAIR